VAYSSFRQVAYLLGGTYSASSMAQAEGLQWPPPPAISLRSMLSYFSSRPMQVVSVAPPPEPGVPRTTLGAGYYDVPSSLGDGRDEGRVNPLLRQTAQLRDGNAILRSVAQYAYANYVARGRFSVSQDMLTAMTQLAVTGVNLRRTSLRMAHKERSSYEKVFC
jgi:hypothetical protein